MPYNNGFDMTYEFILINAVSPRESKALKHFSM